jgi:hypothetical protein
MPVESLSGREKDRYATIRPSASVTVELGDEGMITDDLSVVKAAVDQAFEFAAQQCVDQMAAIGKEFREIYKQD